ncbi:MAG: D-2-hydroxyacid dehydrogenase [Chloroflexi bacterium]|nr:D-2-hydroxyacid dehydrogenase [Chloroflexota bacterium]
MKETFEKRNTGIRHFQVFDRESLKKRMSDIQVLVISGLWHNSLLDNASRLRWIQSIGAGFDQFPIDELKKRGIRLSRSYGVNRYAVAEHAFALILGLTRHLHQARDNQRMHVYRGLISDLAEREDELGGKTLGIIGLGHIGARVAEIGKAFRMRVIATKRNPTRHTGTVDLLLGTDGLQTLLRESDFVVLNCPLTLETRGIMNASTIALMKPSAYLINVARGACVDEAALLEALKTRRIAGAGLDHFVDDPLPPSSPFWDLDNVIITPHTAGETRRYEENVIDILIENLGRLERGDPALLHQVV